MDLAEGGKNEWWVSNAQWFAFLWPTYPHGSVRVRTWGTCFKLLWWLQSPVWSWIGDRRVGEAHLEGRGKNQHREKRTESGEQEKDGSWERVEASGDLPPHTHTLHLDFVLGCWWGEIKIAQLQPSVVLGDPAGDFASFCADLGSFRLLLWKRMGKKNNLSFLSGRYLQSCLTSCLRDEYICVHQRHVVCRLHIWLIINNSIPLPTV